MKREVEKTWKRETALVLLANCMALGWSGHPQALQALSLLALPTFAFAAAAFGLDAYAKQVQRGPVTPDK